MVDPAGNAVKRVDPPGALSGCAIMRGMSSADSRAVVVVGSINEDVMLQLDRPVRPGETVIAHSVERRPGGKGANQAVAAATAGAEVAMLAAVGDDPAG